ncbi:STAS domain-containing protein [Streptomyces sp. NRRL F-2664]|uniref:STAS domain-containing protein n=1 Tax=Streptomyces sp. NRRL F-2664 TaxID=1463842 RepID=UPI00068BE0ED|nr:STAS domain-containing protein [Streptomyces sp. NRRL F-2664]
MSTNPSDSDLPVAAPELKTDTIRVGGALVCVLSGDLYLGTAAVGGRTLREALDRLPALLVVDLNAVELFTADGLKLLLALRDSARARGVPLALVSPSRGVRQVLEMTGAADSFAVHATVEEAIARQGR